MKRRWHIGLASTAVLMAVPVLADEPQPKPPVAPQASPAPQAPGGPVEAVPTPRAVESRDATAKGSAAKGSKDAAKAAAAAAAPGTLPALVIAPTLVGRGWSGIWSSLQPGMPSGSLLQLPQMAPVPAIRPSQNLGQGKIDLNTASLEQLQNLPGVGAAWAPKILAGRPYRIIDDLARDGIPFGTIEKIRPLITLGP